MVKLRLVIAYDGTRYQGWQTQKIGLGVQQRVDEAMQRLYPDATSVQGSSRTDTGVHALGMVAHVEIPQEKFKTAPSKLKLSLNAFLPEDIRVMEVSRARPKFHARFDASGKQYRYLVWNHSVMNPLLRTQAWQVPVPVDIKAMRQAAPSFLGKHDFQSFTARSGYEPGSTIRTVTRCDIRKSGPRITFIIEGDGFLYRMCRGIVGTLIQIGRGKYKASDVKQMLIARDRRVAGMSAPPHGLVLWKVYYKKR